MRDEKVPDAKTPARLGGGREQGDDGQEEPHAAERSFRKADLHGSRRTPLKNTSVNPQPKNDSSRVQSTIQLVRMK